MKLILSTSGTVIIEIVGNPARFFISLLLGFILAAVFVWACWKVGLLWNTAFRPGIGTFFLAVSGGTVLFIGVVVLSATGYSLQLRETMFGGIDGSVSSLGAVAQQRCSEVKAALPYLNRYLENPLSIDCNSPEALSTLRQQSQSGFANVDGWVRDRLFWNQIDTLAAVVLAVVICLGWPSWRAYRSIVVVVQASDT
jgi:hypothetical protein